MTDIFVDSAASGAADGTSKTDAYVTLAAASGSTPGAGDVIKVSHTHSETGTASVTLNFDGTEAQPVWVRSINFSGDAYTKGASIRKSGGGDISITGQDCIYQGLTLVSGDDILMTGSTLAVQFRDCTIGTAGGSSSQISTGNSAGQMLIFEDCIFEFANSATQILTGSTSVSHMIFRGGSVSGSITNFIQTNSNARSLKVDMEGMDLTSVTNIFDVNGGSNPVDFTARLVKCKLNASVNITTAPLTPWKRVRVDAIECQIGTITTAAFNHQHIEKQGNSFTSTARYRTGGADDGEQANAVSQEVTALASQTFKGFQSTYFDIGVYLDTSGTSKTFTVHCAHNAVGSGTAGALQDDEMWLEILGPSEKATSDAQGFHDANRHDPSVTPSDLTSESGGTWTGTNVGTKQSANVVYTNEIEGFVQIRVHIATGSGSDVVVNVDPKIVVSET